MNNKDNKTALKKARENYMKKDYKNTIKACKRILKDDKDNYGALTLLGAAFQEVEELRVQIPGCLKKAASLQPENPLAWKGLLRYYEKDIENEDVWPDLISAYTNVLLYDSEATKFEHNATSCCNLILRLKNDEVFERCMQVFRTLYTNFGENDSDKSKHLGKALAPLLTEYPNVSADYDDLLLNALAGVVCDNGAINRQDYYKRYLKLLYKLKKCDLQLQEAAKMHELFPQNSYPLEWICRTYSEQVILHDKQKDFPVTKYHEHLLTLNKNSYFALLAKATDMYIRKSYIGCRDILSYIVSTKVLLSAWILLIKVNMKLYSWELAEGAALETKQVMSDSEDEKLKEKVELYLIESMIRSNNKSKLETVLNSYTKILDDNSPKYLALLARTYILLDRPEATAVLAKLKKHDNFKREATILKATQLFNRNQLEEAVDVLGSALDTPEAWLLMGKIYSKMGDFGHSHMAFLKGVQADPNYWECLVHLGHYYKDHGDDLVRSRKCYQKALQINPNCTDAGISLTIVYRMLNDDKANLELLEQITSEGNGPKWAWLQLGLLKMEQGDPQESIKCLRNVIRLDPTDSNSWEALADAYFARGAFTSAMKSYQKTLELRPDSSYSMMQVAHIKLLLSQYEEAKEEYEKVIQKKEDNMVAVKGLAETHLGLAKSFIAEQRLERASVNIQIAVDHLVSIVTKRSEFACIWKLLGNACYLMAQMPEKYCSLKIPPGLIKSNTRTGDAQVEILKRDILSLAVRSYCRALNLSSDDSLIWHDLAISYLTQIEEDPSIDRNEAVTRCLSAIKHAIRLRPTAWNHWNVLGVICMNSNIKNYALAQHSFATAIDLEHNNPVTWTNLGCLYLILGDSYKANEAFSWAQRNDPAYVNSWVGQAMIAEQLGYTEAMDLFRHATQITYQSQGAFGYARWVIQMLLDPSAKNNPSYTYSIVNMHAVPVAMDCINWYLVRFPTDVCALNIRGLLLERQKMYKSAAESFSQALEYTQDADEKDNISINLARVCVQLGQYDRAIKLCAECTKTSFKSHCQLAITLFKAERYEESYATYEAILELLAHTDSQKGHVLCAMAAMAYMFESIDAVKTLLFQCIGLKPPIVSGLLAAAALGILDGDQNLTSLILRELDTFKDNEEYRHHIALLSTCWTMKLHGLDMAIRHLVKIIHRHPGDARLWTHLVKFLLNAESDLVLTCALKALFLGRDISELHLSKIASIASFSELKNNPASGIKSVLKMVHAFPGCVDNWATLIAALLSMTESGNGYPNPRWIAELTSIVRKELSCSQDMVQWLLNNEKYSIQMCEKIPVESM